MCTRFVCLANSYKEGGRCIAGIELTCNNEPVLINGSPKWIRPVSGVSHGELNTMLVDSFKVLDILEIKVIQPSPILHQTENVLFTDESLKVIGRFSKYKLKGLCDSKDLIFETDFNSLSDKAIAKLDHSLMLIAPHDCDVINRGTDPKTGRPKLKLCFNYNDNEYEFPITDPVFISKYQKDPEFGECLEDVMLTLSVGVKFEVTNKYYKLVAAIIY